MEIVSMDSTEDQPIRTNDTVGNLWRFYEEHASQARQHENLRATVTSILSLDPPIRE
jgi:hypothetical protein